MATAKRVTVIFGLFGLALCLNAFAQEDSWHEKVLLLVQGGRYQEAQGILEARLAAKNKLGEAQAASTGQGLFLAAFVHAALGDDSQAEERLAQLKQIEERIGRKFIPGLDRFENWGQAMFWPIEKHERALPVLERFLPIEETVLGPDHPAVIVDRTMLAVVLANLGRSQEANLHAGRAFAAAENTLGRDIDTLTLVLRSLGKAFHKAANYSQAEAALEHSLRRALENASLEVRQRYVSSIQSTLADSYRMQGKTREAEPHYRAVWERWNKGQLVLPPKEHMKKFLEEYLAVLEKLGRSGEAREVTGRGKELLAHVR